MAKGKVKTKKRVKRNVAKGVAQCAQIQRRHHVIADHGDLATANVLAQQFVDLVSIFVTFSCNLAATAEVEYQELVPRI